MKFAVLFCSALVAFASAVKAEVSPQKLYDEVSPSLVAVQFQFEGETLNHEFIGPGIVVSDDGLVATPLALFSVLIPDAQMKDFKVIIPSQDKDADELDATFVGRDERSNLAFLKVKEKHDWKPLKFVQADQQVGQRVYSVGLLPKQAAYKTYLMSAQISAKLRGETPQILVDTGLAAAGSPVFDTDGNAIGLVNQGPSIFLNGENPNQQMVSIEQPPKMFTPASDFLKSLSDPPTAGQPQILPWVGIPSMQGINKDTADVYGLKNVPAIQIGEVLPDTPGAKAGLEQGNIITKVNGQPLDRPDEPEELPGLLAKQLRWMKVGDRVTFTVIPKPGDQPKDVTVTLEERPMMANRAKRFFASDLGFVARQVVFNDTYRMHLAADTKGAVVALVKPSGAAESAHLQNGDVITTLNGQPVTDVDEFKTDYEAFRKDKPKEAVVLVVRRGPGTESIRIEPPQ